MASSSVSQESLDMDDFDNTARRNRIRVHRGHGGRGSLPYRSLQDRGEAVDSEGRGDHHNGDTGEIVGGSLGLSSHGHLPGDHESPTRGAAARLKDKRSRANHMKGKLPKDKRKLREKRRSTGVVHCKFDTTESTGDSLDDDDDNEDATHDTKRNTTFNEGGNTGHHHQTLYETRHSPATTYSHQRRNKSPSDLEADLEDNQDYDSTVSHSETNLTLIGRSESSDMSHSIPAARSLGSATSSSSPRFGGVSTPSKFSPESNRAAFKFNPNNVSSDADSSRTPSTSSSSSFLSRYRDVETTLNTNSTTNTNNNGTHISQEPSSPRRFNSTSTNSSIGGSPRDTVITPQIQPRPVGFSAFRDRDRDTASSPLSARPERTAYSSSLAGSRFGRDRDTGAAGSSSLTSSRLTGYQSPRPFMSTTTTPAVNPQQTETISQLEKQLEKEKEDNKKLQSQLEEKDKKIAELEKQIELLNNECDGFDEDNLKLQEENRALIRAMSKLTTNV